MLTFASYPWSDGQTINTMQMQRSYLATENEGKIEWGGNGATTYAVINKDAKNQYGEYPGYRIVPSKLFIDCNLLHC